MVSVNLQKTLSINSEFSTGLYFSTTEKAF